MTQKFIRETTVQQRNQQKMREMNKCWLIRLQLRIVCLSKVFFRWTCTCFFHLFCCCTARLRTDVAPVTGPLLLLPGIWTDTSSGKLTSETDALGDDCMIELNCVYSSFCNELSVEDWSCWCWCGSWWMISSSSGWSCGSRISVKSSSSCSSYWRRPVIRMERWGFVRFMFHSRHSITYSYGTVDQKCWGTTCKPWGRGWVQSAS